MNEMDKMFLFLSGPPGGKAEREKKKARGHSGPSCGSGFPGEPRGS